ncbi:DUF2917 domain-containing protein [Caldimonas tepidiphila]|uniref:DUF2917 domain-containing protein n=1 Tax=Caldimonas tepidiphila TaxID=2315841 RepID=UPI001300572F|nr:DUF2917 domain-containing protein [Caldimonas tepidiphila]
MPVRQESGDTGWQLAPGEACSWVAPKAHLLEVVEGRLWITCTRRGEPLARDVVLARGETLRVERGDRLVLEGWPGARFEFKLVREPRARRPQAAQQPGWIAELRGILGGRRVAAGGG